MTKGNKGGSQLRKNIRASVLASHQLNQPIDRNAIKAQYTAKKPSRERYISTIVEDYSNHLEGRGKGNAANTSPIVKAPLAGVAVDRSSIVKGGSPISSGYTPPKQTVPSRQAVKVKSDSEDSVSDDSVEDSEDSASSDATEPEEDVSQKPDNALLQDFKEHLAGSDEQQKATAALSALPSLDVQQQFLTSDDEDNEVIGRATSSLDHSVLVSAMLERNGYSMPSQFALLGKLIPSSKPTNEIPDQRAVLNTNVPFSAFICGLQGSGKSHTTSCIIENCSMPMPALGNLKKSLSTLVLHFNEYSSNVNSQPSEAAFLASVLPKYASQQQPLPLRVLVSPTNHGNLSKMYSEIPNVKVLPFKLQPRHLNISMMLSLMSMSQSDSMPLYMAQVIRVLREMAMESGGHFDYMDFRRRLDNLRLDRAQTPFLYQRLDLLDSYLDLQGQVTGDYFVDGGVTILDLSCPFVDQSTACVLFKIAIDLFLYSHPSRGKMIVADEAHKYMTDTAAAKELTETFLTIIRQQRHLGVRTIISTQEPTISPRLIDLCSITIIHRFTSPQWYNAIRTHLPIEKGTNHNEHGIPDGLYQIASLRTGEALVFAPSAHLLDEAGSTIDTKHYTFKLKVRKRITWDGGRTIVCVR
ncbi:hypothetical protein BDW59DRAFT_145336 [Aspergillus cavernicola]|uniref:Zona occludens toxin N-terminal domain-containing protein n=1 Tax=Aspergillus cavernicola TaxID=176166 RepID=A0ABR4IES4_9EURO